MAEIIDIRERLRKNSGGGIAGRCGPLRVRLYGPDMHWVGLLADLLAEALAQQGYPVAVEFLPDSEGAALDLVTGQATESVPRLLVAGIPLNAEMLRECDEYTLLLIHKDEEESPLFPGRVARLPFPWKAHASLDLAVACAAGTARLLGVIGWGALEQALRRALTITLPLEDSLILAFETYHRLAAWEGGVWISPDEIC
jgi:hypothetical protein